MAIPAAAVMVAALAAAPPVNAATDVVTPKDCKITPQDGDDVTVTDPTPLDPDDDPTLSETLDPCNGVLAPEPVGDGDMTIPPPEGGETPVIEPGELPRQRPQKQ
jgi:hypothetical protein